MAFEQENTEELEQLQKQKENEHIQQELDLAIARIENDQIQRELDAAIESLDQQCFHQDENTEEQVIDDQEAQQSSSTEEELASHESVTEEKSDQQNSLDESIHTWDDELISQHEENNEEQRTRIQDLTKTKYSIQEEEVIERDQDVELNLLQMREEDTPFQQDLDVNVEHLDQVAQPLLSTEKVTSSNESVTECTLEHLYSLEQSRQSSDDQSIGQREKEQRTLNLNIEKNKNLIQETNETLSYQKTEANLLQLEEENTQFQQDLDAIIKSSDHPSQQKATQTYPKCHNFQQKEYNQEKEQKIQNVTRTGKSFEEIRPGINTPLQIKSIGNHKYDDKDSKEIKSQNTTSNKLNLLINKTEIMGSQTSETRSIIDIQEFIDSWNRISDAGKDPTINMINSYNSIKIKYNGNLYAILKKDGKMYIRDYYDLNTITNPWFTGNSPVYPLRYKEWFIFTEKLEGESAFIKVWINDDRTGSKKLFLIQNAYTNSKPAWNQKGIKKGQWKTKYSFIKSGLFEKVDIGGRKNPLKMKIIKELEKKYSYPDNWKGQKRWIDKVYRLKYDKNLINEHLEIMYREKERSTRIRRRHKGKLFLKNYYKKFGLLKYYTDATIDTEFLYSGDLNQNFEIAFVDESQALLKVIKELQTDFNITKSNWNEWIDNMYNFSPIYSLVQCIQRAKLASIINSDIKYNIIQAERMLGRGNSLSREPLEFWDENSKYGFSRLAKAFIGDSEMRKNITMFTKRSVNLPILSFRTEVIAGSNWGHNSFINNLVSIPDIIVKYRKGKRNIAVETVQNKLARKIGRRSGEINCEHYLLDYFKTIGNYDVNHQISNLQFEFIPFGKTLGGLTDIAKENNLIIISYWGRLDPVFSRFGEIISAFHRVGKFGENIVDEAVLSREIYELLNYGKRALGFSRQIDEITRKTIVDLIVVAKNANGELTFFLGAFLEFLRKFGNS